MAALRFQIHVDKENTGAIGANPKHRHGATAGGIRGKVFQESGTPGFVKSRKALGDVNTPASTRPRKALGDVNGTNEAVLKGKSGLKPLSLNTQSFKKPDTKKQQEKSLKKQELKVQVGVSQATPSVRPMVDYEEIEHMHNERDPDTDEEIWPARERISTYIDKLISWRPPCLFGVHATSDEETEEEEKRIADMIGQLDSLPFPTKPTVEEPIPPAESLVDPMPFEDIPYADITLESMHFPLSDNLLDVTPQGLEDSFCVVPRLGTLALRDDL